SCSAAAARTELYSLSLHDALPIFGRIDVTRERTITTRHAFDVIAGFRCEREAGLFVVRNHAGWRADDTALARIGGYRVPHGRESRVHAASACDRPSAIGITDELPPTSLDGVDPIAGFGCHRKARVFAKCHVRGRRTDATAVGRVCSDEIAAR